MRPSSCKSELLLLSTCLIPSKLSTALRVTVSGTQSEWISLYFDHATEGMRLWWVFTTCRRVKKQNCHTMTLSWGVWDFGNIGSWSLSWASRHFALPKIRERLCWHLKNFGGLGPLVKNFRPIRKFFIYLLYKCCCTWGPDRHNCGKLGDQWAVSSTK